LLKVHFSFYSTESLRKPPKTAIHLWEFLLNLLLDEKCDHMICWTNREAGEFKLKNQEEVARRWGNLKHRPGMNYDKLSRALRYYYQKGIIKKVFKITTLFWMLLFLKIIVLKRGMYQFLRASSARISIEEFSVGLNFRKTGKTERYDL